MSEVVCQIIIVALIAAFIILFANKTELRWALRNYFDSYKITRIVANMLDCDFCLSFWTCFIISLIFFAINGNIILLVLVPVCAAPITRYII